METTDELLTEHEAAAILKFSVSTLRKDRWQKHLKIPVIFLGKSVRYTKNQLMQWALNMPTQKVDISTSMTDKKRGRPTKASILARN